MPLIKIVPKLETESAQFYELGSRRFAIVRVDPDVGAKTMEEAQSILHQFLDMDVLMVNFDATIELVEVEGPTWQERIAKDD